MSSPGLHHQYQSLNKIPGQLGYLVIGEDGAVIVVSDFWKLFLEVFLSYYCN